MKKSTPSSKITKATARRPSPQELQKAIRTDRMKKISYHIPTKGSVEFNPPEVTHWNRMLANHKPMEKVDSTGKLDMKGKLGHVKRFFIDEKELHRLQALFQRFHIPNSLYRDLTWCYLNMVFAQTDVRIGEQYAANLNHSMKALYKFFDLLHGLTADEYKIEAATISVKVVNKKGKATATEKLKMLGPLDTGFLEDVLKLFSQVEAFPAIDAFYQIEKNKNADRLPRNMGHKNAEKHAESYYANALIDYLWRNVFHSLGELSGDMDRLRKETDRLKALYSDRQLCLFIGLMMRQAGLLPTAEDADDDALIDLIKKKVGGRLAQRAEVRGQIRGKKQRPK
jgi:hypothetical protein